MRPRLCQTQPPRLSCSSRNKYCFEIAHDSFLAHRSECLIFQLTSDEVEQSRNRLDSKFGRKRWIFLNIYLGDFESPCLFSGDLFKHGGEHFARPAPCGPEID